MTCTLSFLAQKMSLKATGKISSKGISYLDEVFWSRSTRGNIPYLLQAKLFYDGYLYWQSHRKIRYKDNKCGQVLPKGQWADGQWLLE